MTTGGECIDDESARTYDLLAACAHAVPPRLRPPRRDRRKEEGTVDEREALLARETLPVGSLRREKNNDARRRVFATRTGKVREGSLFDQ